MQIVVIYRIYIDFTSMPMHVRVSFLKKACDHFEYESQTMK